MKEKKTLRAFKYKDTAYGLGVSEPQTSGD